jgi:hypothetical protein
MQQQPDPLELRPHTSIIVEELMAELKGQKPTIADLLARLRGRAYGLLLVVVSILSLIPGLSFVGGVIIIVFAAQMMIGRTSPVLPGVIARRRVPMVPVARYVARVLPTLRFVERFVRPRLAVATIPPLRAIAGIVLIGLGVTLFIPFPFSQIAPALAALVISIALLERDGVAFLAGFVLAFGALLLSVWTAMIAWKTFVGVFG